MIRPATPDDAEEIGALEVELFGTGAWATASVSATLASPRAWGRVDLDDAGRLAAYVVTSTAGEVTDLLRIGVRPDHQQAGLGGLLLTAALDAAREHGAHRVLLEVGALNDAALALYHGHGFAVIDRRRRYYPDGSDALVLSREL